MSSEIIQNVAYDKLWWFSTCELHIFTKFHFTIFWGLFNDEAGP